MDPLPPPTLPPLATASHTPSLPPDLWQLIISFAPVRPRLLVLCLVSKRWLQWARMSVKSLPYLSVPAEVASRFPSLTHLTNPAWLPLPPHITALTLIGTRKLPAVTHLTDLTLKHVDRDVAAALLTANQRTLTRICVAHSLIGGASFLDHIGATDFPRLRDLSVHVNDVPRARLVSLVTPLLPQLTSLSVRYDRERESIELPGPPLPLLRHLEAPYLFVVALMPHAPSLTSVACSVPVSWAFPRLSRLAHLSVSLNCSLLYKNDYAVMQASLRQLPRLRCLRFMGPSRLDSPAAEAVVANALTTLRVLQYEGKADHMLRDLRLPYLTAVHTRINCDPAYAPFATLTALVSNHPTLRRILCRFSIATLGMLKRQQDAIMGFLVYAEARGVEIVMLCVDDKNGTKFAEWLEQTFARHLRWLRLVFTNETSASVEDFAAGAQEAFIGP